MPALSMLPMCAPTLNASAALSGISIHTMPRHVEGPGFMFWVFHVIRDYARTLAKGGSRMADRLSGWLELSDQLEAAQCPCRSSSATMICCPPISLMTGTGSG
jgi:hypothetical protein